uniref:FAD-binding PCMH-type domain-containing protein n=1 Tax=Varanus komodoensis TaxID=61221 RepID=A0A8D2JGV8_VARKO
MISAYERITKKIVHYSVNACLIPVCSLYGTAVITVEGVGNAKTRIHPVQERIAKSHGSQCGFCTPGMVMSIYALLRNQVEPTSDQIMEALAGNLCRCTGYRPIIDGCKTFCKVGICVRENQENETWKLSIQLSYSFPNYEDCEWNPDTFQKMSVHNLNSESGLFFLQKIAENQTVQTLTFHGERTTWISPVNLQELLKLKARYPKAPLVVGNTCVGVEMKFKGAFYPLLISPTRILDLHVVEHTKDGCVSQNEHSYLKVVEYSGLKDGITEHHCAAHSFILLSPPLQGEFVSGFRQATRRENALPIANAGMRVLFEDGCDIIRDLSIFYGGIGPTTVAATQTCQKLIGRLWDEQMLNEACRAVIKEILPSSVQGDKVDYKRTLLVSFIFKFYLEVLHSLKTMVIFCLVHLQGFCVLQLYVSRLIHTLFEPAQLAQDPVGHAVMHQAGIKHATGEAIYCDDIRAMDEELFLALVTSSRAHAKIVSIDASEALKMSGVVDIISVQDVPATNEFYNYDVPDIVFAREKVTCVGQVVCAVVADSDVHAKQATAKVKIEYEPQEPVILTIEEAIQHNSFFEPKRKLEQGNVDEAFKAVDHILEGEFHIGGQSHFYMETQSVLVVPKGEDKEMDVYTSTQHPAYVQEMVASCLGIPDNRIMCHVKRIGGAFGGKLQKTSLLACIAAVAANKTGHAVRCILDRGTDMLTTGGRHPFFGKYKVSGRIKIMLLKMDNAYKVPNIRCHAHVCKTNLPSNTAFRGFGFPQGGLFTEVWMTRIAARCGLLPTQIRELNMYKENERTPYKQELKPENLLRCWNKCMEKSAYHTRRAAVEEFNKQNYWKKKGLAIIPMKFPVGFVTRFLSQVSLKMYKVIFVPATLMDITIASRELQMPMSNIHFCETSTTTVPNACGSVGSMGTDVNGMAVKDACQTLLKRLEPIISQNPKGTWKEWAKDAFEQSINLSVTGYFRGYEANMDWEKGEGHPFEYFIYGAACTEVEIDCLTGDHKNIKTDIVMDIGRSINPAVDIGQIEGAFVQGIGLYTMEELKFSPEGVLCTRGPDQYKIPAVCDIPEHFSVSLLTSSQQTTAIYSSKGLGESALFLGCSVFFAIWDAVAAVRKERGLSADFKLNSPLTSERIRMACTDQFTAMVNILAPVKICQCILFVQ